jgi:hypothetical protein
MTLVKSAPKKVLAKKVFYQLKICLSPKNIGFLEKPFLGVLLLRSYVHFGNQYEKTDFLIPHST